MASTKKEDKRIIDLPEATGGLTSGMMTMVDNKDTGTQKIDLLKAIQENNVS